MAFVVEDNTGLEDANAYIDVAFFRDYADLLYDVTGLSDDAIKSAITKVTLNYIDVNYNIAGSPLNTLQALQFPTDLHLIDNKIRRAVADAVIVGLKGELFLNIDPAGKIKSVMSKLDVLEKETVYQDNTSTYQSSFGKAPTTDKLLKPYLAYSGGAFARWPQ